MAGVDQPKAVTQSAASPSVMRVSRQYAVALNIPAGSNQNVTVNLDAADTLPATWTAVGYFNQSSGGSWLDHAGWVVTASTSTSITFSFAQQSATGPGVGTFYFHIVMIG